MRSCDACGNTQAFVSMGGATLCRDCEPGIRVEMDQLREEGKPVNVLHIAKSIFRETHNAGNYLLRDIPEKLWHRAKHRSIDEGCSLRILIIKSLEEYLADPDVS